MPTASQLHNRRFTAFLLTAGLLTVALFWADHSVYPVFAASLGTIFGVYATGQSYTDGKRYDQGHS